MRVLLPYFPLVAWGDDAPLWCCVTKVRIVATFWWSHLPLGWTVACSLLVGFWSRWWTLTLCVSSSPCCSLPSSWLCRVMGVRLAVPPMGVLALRCCFLYFPWVAWGGGAFTWNLMPCHAPWRSSGRRSLPF
ncbi:hypothetical protein Taro_019183 [Colocasia esculenta]|uniref:Uncharacterized protein n=1 Tax=Colocasia esculenta TaxID=4460 RepID=A0A843UVM7_COLES|nr:hypothetical protein [Colocasia esculenta]